MTSDFGRVHTTAGPLEDASSISGSEQASAFVLDMRKCWHKLVRLEDMLPSMKI